MGRALTLAMRRFGELLLTRERGKDVVRDIPDDLSELTLDFEGVDVASPSFLDEVLRGAFSAGASSVAFVNASERTNTSLERLLNRERADSEDEAGEAHATT